jgi:hypothetical protein
MALAYHQHEIEEASEEGRAYEKAPRGTVMRRTSNPLLRGLQPSRWSLTESVRLAPAYRERPGYHLRRARVAARQATVRMVFDELKKEWLEDTEFTSSVSDLVGHPAHLSIIGLGPDVLPLLLADLAADEQHWFWALRAITRVDAADGAETYDEAREAWLVWGQQNGFVVS